MALTLSMPRRDLDEALERLLEIAHRPWTPSHIDGVWQLLPMPA